MSEVGALIIRLQAETAKFRDDMGKVKSDLNNLKGGGEEAGRGINSGMGEARGGLMLVEDAVGVRLPRHLNSLIAKIPGVGAAFSAMLPIAGVVVAIEIIGELIKKHQEAKEQAEKMLTTHINLQGAIASTYNSLHEKLLQAGIAADNLNGNHLAAVKKQLELIDMQSMDELARTFDTLAKSAEASFAELKAHWYELSAGSDGAKHSLASFQAQYELLLKTGKGDEANKLLDEKIKREREILKLQQQATSTTPGGGDAAYQATMGARLKLQEMKIGFDKKEIQSEQDLVDILQAQVNARQTIAQTSKINSGNVVNKDNLTTLGDEAALQKIATAGVLQHQQALIRLARTQAETSAAAIKGGEDDSIDGKLAKQKAIIEAEKSDSIEAAQAELVAKSHTYDADMKAAGSNATKKKAIAAQWANDVEAFMDQVTQFNADADRKMVDADRTAAIEKMAIAKSVQNATSNGIREMAELNATIGLKADEQASKNRAALHKTTAAQQLSDDLAFSKRATQIELDGYDAQLKNLDKFDKNYLAKVIELENKKNQAITKGTATEAAIRTAAAQKEAAEIKAAEDRMADAVASSVAKSIIHNQSLAQSFRDLGAQIAEEMIKNLILMELDGDKTKLIKAKKAFHNAMGDVPFPANLVVAPLVFAATMAFEKGGKIPGDGAVPIIGHGGETVVTKALTDRVEASERGGGSNMSTGMNVHYAPQIHAVDSTGVDALLSKHGAVFQRHIQQAVRRMNK